VEVENVDLALKPGMTASVRIRTGEAKDVLSLPSAALNFVPPGETAGEGSAVWVLARDRLQRVPVTRGLSTGEATEIAGGALKAGDNVVIDLTAAGRRAYGLGS
jgi:HlyD family secretion protein